MPRATLITLAGLPGVGKTCFARALAARLSIMSLRIDTIEQIVHGASGPVGPVGYRIAQAIARDNLSLGVDVIADMVNPVAVSRTAWRTVAASVGARLIEIELICSDPAEHRRRIESRASDVPGLVLPDWAAVQAMVYEPWDRERIVIDTTRLKEGDIPGSVIERLGAQVSA